MRENGWILTSGAGDSSMNIFQKWFLFWISTCLQRYESNSTIFKLSKHLRFGRIQLEKKNSIFLVHVDSQQMGTHCQQLSSICSYIFFLLVNDASKGNIQFLANTYNQHTYWLIRIDGHHPYAEYIFAACLICWFYYYFDVVRATFDIYMLCAREDVNRIQIERNDAGEHRLFRSFFFFFFIALPNGITVIIFVTLYPLCV